MTTKTEQNNGIAMFNTGNEGSGGLRISYSSRKIRGSAYFHLIKCANRLKGQICKKPPFSEVYGIFLATLNVQSLYSCHMKKKKKKKKKKKILLFTNYGPTRGMDIHIYNYLKHSICLTKTKIQ